MERKGSLSERGERGERERRECVDMRTHHCPQDELREVQKRERYMPH